jgi:pSer/pThr/pTyr-binding forkhead associated (FHA) protein
MWVLTTEDGAEIPFTFRESTNGTYVNGTRVERATLRGGEKLGVGRVDLVVTRSTIATALDPNDSNRGSENQE